MINRAVRILVINVNWVGDVLFSTPFIRAIRQAYPGSYIACLVHPRCVEMLEGNPRINEIIVYDEEGLHRSLFGKLRLIMLLKKKRFDTAFLLHRSFTKALLAALAGISSRIGYPTKKRSWLLTKAVEEYSDEPHKVEYFLNIARACGIKRGGTSYEFFVNDADRKFARDLLAENGIKDADTLAVICPGGNWDPKRWPKENFAGLADILIEQFSAKVVISGAKKDARLADEIKRLMKHVPAITCGRTTLRQLGALLERADLVIANDTGPMHIAVAMKTKVIALFGPTSPEITGPYGEGEYRVISKWKECDIPCYDLTCRDNRCMAAISVEEVVAVVEELLGNSQKLTANSKINADR